MKDYFISNLQDAEKFIISALNTNEARHFVINYLDCHDLNYSSMRGFVGIKYVSTTEQLLEALENINSFCYDKIKPEDFFLLDEKLIRWEKLLNG